MNSGRVGLITRFDTTDYPTRIAAEVTDFDPGDAVDKKEVRRMDLAELYAMYATDRAVHDGGLDLDGMDMDRCGVVIGSGIGGITTFEKQHSMLEKSDPGRV